jgi:hypothetical protein
VASVDASQRLEGLTTVKTVLDAARTLGLKAWLDCSLWHIIDIACLTYPSAAMVKSCASVAWVPESITRHFQGTSSPWQSPLTHVNPSNSGKLLLRASLVYQGVDQPDTFHNHTRVVRRITCLPRCSTSSSLMSRLSTLLSTLSLTLRRTCNTMCLSDSCIRIALSINQTRAKPE